MVESAGWTCVRHEQAFRCLNCDFSSAIGRGEVLRGDTVPNTPGAEELPHQTSHELWATVGGNLVRYTECPEE